MTSLRHVTKHYTTLSTFALVGTLLLLGPAHCTINMSEYNCTTKFRSTPTSVHELTPADIGVVLGIGDSIMAGFGIDGRSKALYEDRGRSFAMGGAHHATTIPNLLQYFRGKRVLGASVGQHLDNLCYGALCFGMHINATDRLNAALSGSLAMNIPPQVAYLVEQLRSEAAAPDSWKLLTLQIGANDQCLACNKNLSEWADGYER